jgi:hypothetical protein
MTTIKEPINNQSITMITKADVIAQFKELHKKHYYSHGHMISTVADEISNEFYASDRSSQFTWHEIYNRHVSDRVLIRSCRGFVHLMGHKFKIRLDGPLIQEHRSEFETYFGFGGHCDGYTENRIVACYPERVDDALDIDELLLNGGSGSDQVDDDYAKQVVMIIVLGGYVKSWGAVSEFEQWFANAVGVEFNTGNELLTHTFNTMEPGSVPKPLEPEKESDPA